MLLIAMVVFVTSQLERMGSNVGVAVRGFRQVLDEDDKPRKAATDGVTPARHRE